MIFQSKSSHVFERFVWSFVGHSAEFALRTYGFVNSSVNSKSPHDALLERCGAGRWDSVIKEIKPQCLWFHAASVGEVGGLIPVIKLLDSAKINGVGIASNRLITTTSLTGQTEVLKHKLTTNSALFPLDSPRVVNKIIDKISPSLCVITETEIWPNFLFALSKRNIPVIYINGRVSDNSYPNYKRIKYLLKPALQSVFQFLVQTETDAKRFIEIGAKKDRVKVAGNTKYDKSQAIYCEQELKSFADALGIDMKCPVFVAGSVRPEEDRKVIQAFKLARQMLPTLQLIIAPRHPKEFENVANMLFEYNFSFHKRSSGNATQRVQVVLLDTIGELSKVYALASCAFVGGSFVDIGGHNPLEPAFYAKPVLMGESIWGVKQVANDLIKEDGLCIVSNEEELARMIMWFCANQPERIKAGENAKKVWSSYQGATDKVVELIQKFCHLEQ